jgi:cell division protease FtsH
MEGTVGPIVDGRVYKTQAFYDAIDVYHREAALAHKQHHRLSSPLPRFAVHESMPIPAFVNSEATAGDNPWGPPPDWKRNGQH